jgi:hypothetical protein
MKYPHHAFEFGKLFIGKGLFQCLHFLLSGFVRATSVILGNMKPINDNHNLC